MLTPLAGVTQQDATPYVSAWLPVGAGAFLQLTLKIAKITGALLVYVETVNDPKDEPRLCGGFKQTNAVGSVHTSMVADRYVRVIAVAGAGAGQSADWTISGDAFVPIALGY